jgi:hypothetical protein
MKHITIVSDSKYLIFGVALIDSLHKTATIPITIHYFCIDDHCFTILQRLQLDNVIPYEPSTLFNESNQVLCHIKKTDFQYLCWSLASIFTNHILHTIECDSVTYIDSDIYFHKDIQLLFNEFGEKDCGIFKHRFLQDYEESPYGKYNVGIVYFKNSTIGREVSHWWSDAVLHRKYPKLATCGDQKYLDLFPRICGKDNIYIDDNIGHGAPWNWLVYGLDAVKDGIITWRGQTQPLVFTHFSKFGTDFPNNKFTCTSSIYGIYTHNGKIYEIPGLYQLHAEYFNALKIAKSTIDK